MFFFSIFLSYLCIFTVAVHGDDVYVQPNPYRARELYGAFNYSGLAAHNSNFLSALIDRDHWTSCSNAEGVCGWDCTRYAQDHPVAPYIKEEIKTIEDAKTPIRSECYQKLNEEEELNHSDNPRVLCVIATYRENHEMAKTAAMTWGRECTGFLAISEYEDESIPTVTLGNVDLEEGYSKLWQKKVHMYSLVRTFFRSEFDFFLFCDDDTYVLSETMYPYLRDIMIRGHNTGLYAGRPYRRGSPDSGQYHSYYNSGGAGYILDQISLDKLFRILDVEKKSGQSACADNVSRYADLPADISISRCLQAAGIFPASTKDCSGKDRFHHTFGYDYDDYIKTGGITFHEHRSLGHREGQDGISRDSITFHDMKNAQTVVGLYWYLRLCK